LKFIASSNTFLRTETADCVWGVVWQIYFLPNNKPQA
jgi:hypothetical protein